MAALIAAILHSALLFRLLASSSQSSYGTYFEEITGNRDKEEISPIKEMFNKNFHHCSLDKICSFLIKNIKEGTYQKISSEAELPKARDGLLIWKRMTVDNDTSEQTTTKQGYKSCQEAKQAGINESGIVVLTLDKQSFRVFCDMKTAGGGWLVFQRRLNGSLSFNRTWNYYVNGFGAPNDNYWFGLQPMHRFTKGKNATLRVDLQHMSGERGFAEYTNFEVGDAASKYTLKVGNYTGDIGDGLRKSNNMQFTTKDQDNDMLPPANCAIAYGGGWWHKHCFDAFLTGLYPDGKDENLRWSMSWVTWKNGQGNITFSEMKFRFNN